MNADEARAILDRPNRHPSLTCVLATRRVIAELDQAQTDLAHARTAGRAYRDERDELRAVVRDVLAALDDPASVPTLDDATFDRLRQAAR